MNQGTRCGTVVRLRSLLLLRSRLGRGCVKLVKVALFGPTDRTTPGVRNPRKGSPRWNSTIGITNGGIIHVATLAALPGRHDADYISQNSALSNDLIGLGARTDDAPDVSNQAVQLLATFAKLRKRGHRSALPDARPAAQDRGTQSIVRDIGLPHRITEVLHADLAIGERFRSIAPTGDAVTANTVLRIQLGPSRPRFRRDGRSGLNRRQRSGPLTRHKEYASRPQPPKALRSLR
jgi:hypothetical protein